jgi:hypothetical protein
MPKKPCLRIKSEAQGAQQAERDMGAHCRKAHATFPEAGRPMMTGLWAAQALAVEGLTFYHKENIKR